MHFIKNKSIIIIQGILPIVHKSVPAGLDRLNSRPPGNTAPNPGSPPGPGTTAPNPGNTSTPPCPVDKTHQNEQSVRMQFSFFLQSHSVD